MARTYELDSYCQRVQVRLLLKISHESRGPNPGACARGGLAEVKAAEAEPERFDHLLSGSHWNQLCFKGSGLIRGEAADVDA